MAHYLIYVPAQHFDAAEKSGKHPLEHVGLPDHIPNAMGVRITDGPDHKGGQLYGWLASTAQHRLNYDSGQQEWKPAVPCGDEPAQRYWLGFWKESPITPRDLIRPQTTPGTELPIGQYAWRIPSADLLPAVAVLGITGEWTTEVRPDYREYWSAAETMRATLAAGFDELEMDAVCEFCLKALSVNYRLTREVASHLQIFSTETAPQILRTAIGLTPVPEGV